MLHLGVGMGIAAPQGAPVASAAPPAPSPPRTQFISAQHRARYAAGMARKPGTTPEGIEWLLAPD